MKIKESEHYIFNYTENYVIENDLNEICTIQENCYKFITDTLKVKMTGKINYYLCSTPDEVGAIYGDNEPCNGFASEPNNIYAVYNDAVKCIGFHEDAHIVSYNTLGIPNETFLREGLAMFFDKGYWGVANFSWVNYFLNNDLYVNIDKLIDNDLFYKTNHVITYTTGGAFTEYLILVFGIDKYKEFYSNVRNDFKDTFNSIYNKTLNEVENDFINYIKSFSNNKYVSNLLNDFSKKLNIK